MMKHVIVQAQVRFPLPFLALISIDSMKQLWKWINNQIFFRQKLLKPASDKISCQEPDKKNRAQYKNYWFTACT